MTLSQRKTDKQVTPISDALLSLGVPHLADYFGVWMMDEKHLSLIVNAVVGMDLKSHVLQSQAAVVSDQVAREVGYQELSGGIALMSLRGPMMKFRSSLSDGTGTVAARQAVRAAANSSDIAGLMIVIDSGGGTTAGTQALAAEIRAAAAKKPVYVFIEDIGASAAFWVAAMATKVMAGPTAMIGSIGTYAVLYDLTAQANQLGIKVHVVKAGEMKGMGTPGTEITAAQLEEAQKVVSALNEQFIGEVAAGRHLSVERVRSLADGRVHIGAAAKDLGLIDGISSFEDALAMLRRDVQAGGRKAPSTKEKNMSDENTGAASAPKAATLAELKAAFPKSDAAFRESCLEKNLTMQAASAAWIARVEEDLAKSQAETEKAKAETEKVSKAAAEAKTAGAAKPLPGARAGGTKAASGEEDGEGAGGDAKSQLAAIAGKHEARGMKPHEAWAKACRENPELRAAYVDEHNRQNADALAV